MGTEKLTQAKNLASTGSSPGKFPAQVIEDLHYMAAESGTYTAVVATYEKYRLFYSWEAFRNLCLKNGISIYRDICRCRDLAYDEAFNRKK